jgi:dTMP kinase
MASAGFFITFEGGDGAGKSTQLAMLQTALSRSTPVTLTREPGGTDLGSKIRTLLLDSPLGSVSSRAEALLYAADRAHHVETVVAPALARGEIVLQDRYIDSSLAYQGAGRGLDAAALRSISEWAAGGLWPDITVLLDLDPAIARTRAASRQKKPDRIESEVHEFRVRLREEFLALAKAEPKRFLVVDASLPRAAQHKKILVAVMSRLLLPVPA